ncbi:MAG: putative transcriptional regulator [Colwellia sp.]|jgi:putative transcriptional regulator
MFPDKRLTPLKMGKFDPSLPLAFKTARLFNMTIEQIFQDEAE